MQLIGDSFILKRHSKVTLRVSLRSTQYLQVLPD